MSIYGVWLQQCESVEWTVYAVMMRVMLKELCHLRLDGDFVVVVDNVDTVVDAVIVPIAVPGMLVAIVVVGTSHKNTMKRINYWVHRMRVWVGVCVMYVEERPINIHSPFYLKGYWTLDISRTIQPIHLTFFIGLNGSTFCVQTDFSLKDSVLGTRLFFTNRRIVSTHIASMEWVRMMIMGSGMVQCVYSCLLNLYLHPHHSRAQLYGISEWCLF